MSFILLSKMATLKINHVRHTISIIQKSTTNMVAISQKLNNRLIGMEFSSVAVFPTLLKREDYKRTTHDNVFSEWQILIRSNDWEDFKHGKTGVSRYRLEGLPPKRCTALYELGVVAPIGQEDLGQKLYPDNVLATYLGESVDVRSRLQEYGRCAGHLPASYFKEIFSNQGSIYFRLAPMGSKWETVAAKRMLLSISDYAWNKLSNGEQRQLDLLQKFRDCEFMSKRKSQVLIPYL